MIHNGRCFSLWFILSFFFSLYTNLLKYRVNKIWHIHLLKNDYKCLSPYFQYITSHSSSVVCIKVCACVCLCVKQNNFRWKYVHLFNKCWCPTIHQCFFAIHLMSQGFHIFTCCQYVISSFSKHTTQSDVGQILQKSSWK